MLEHLVDKTRLFALIASLESDLRELLATWVLPYKAEEDVFGGRLATLKERARRDGVDGPAPELIHYADFADSFEFLNRHRDMLPEGIARAVREQTPELEKFVGPRNRVMHARPLRERDLDYGVELCRRLLESSIPLPTVRSIVRAMESDPGWAPPGAPQLDVEVSSVLHNLPVAEFDETGLIGRERESRDLLTHLKRRRDRVVTLVGEGGMGKTALAVQTLYDLVDDSACPFDAVLWSSLKSERLTGEGVVAIGDAARDVLGVVADLAAPLDESVQHSATALGQGIDGIETLIVIDNVESTDSNEIVRFSDALPDTASVLLTSRVGLGQLERRIPVGPLEPDAAAKLMRLYASRRGVTQLACLEQAALRRQVERLRRTPLAVRWFVEAVAAGADPQTTIGDQTALLRFCLETIYTDLSELARRALSVMYAAGAPLDAAQLAVITDAPTDDLNRSLQDLQRRSLVEVSLEGHDGLRQLFRPTAATRQYLASVDRPSSETLREAESRLAELRESERHRQEGQPTGQAYIEVLDAGQKAVAHLLRKAVLLGKKNRAEADRLVEQAESLAPHFFEVWRVKGLLLSQAGTYEAADDAYRRAYEAAPDARQRARVAYFWSWTKSFCLQDRQGGIDSSREAAKVLGTPAADARLAQCLIAGGLHEEAEDLLRRVVGSDDPRAVMIARTQLITSAKRRVESSRKGKLTGEAIRIGSDAVIEAGAYIDTGVADSTLRARVLDLTLETLSAYADGDGANEVERVLKLVGYALRHSTELLVSGNRRYWVRLIDRLRVRRDVPQAVKLDLDRLVDTLANQANREVLAGRIFSFDAEKGYGFITPETSTDRVFFHRDDLVDARTVILLRHGMPMTFTVTVDERGARGGQVSPAVPQDEEQNALRGRRLTIRHKTELFAIATDRDTRGSVFLDARAMRRDVWAAMSLGDQYIGDLELVEKGARVIAGTLREPPARR